ncbi:hypothetical protein RKD18_001839 [Streptomyces phaeoluteigriseus]
MTTEPSGHAAAETRVRELAPAEGEVIRNRS